ncbi:hypothetical protein [Agrobacterium tumefaciens]|nr:hypothetical protein [Agrobacterium tumefaciens]UNZ49514.1 hypothetical protein MLE07_08960 [Agrobacterium tumefaciens]
MTALYTSGTISLVNGSAVITGIDTAWETALIVGGTVHVEAEGNPLPILPDDSAGDNEHPITDTQMTAAIKWLGATGTYKYALVRENTYTSAQAANADKIAELLRRLNHPTIAAIAGVQGMQDHLILLTGPSTATIIPRTSLIQGIEANATVETPAGLATYDGEAAGFIVLVSNAGNQRAALYFKKSATSGDWSAPAFLTGEQGIQGDVGPRGITWRGLWDGATAYAKYDVVRNNKSAWIALRANTNITPPVLPTTANADWELFAPAGMDGTGTGDVVGPSSVTAGNLAQYTDTTGKVIGRATIGSPALLGRITAGAGDVERLTVAQARQVLGGWEVIGSFDLAGLTQKDIAGLGVFKALKIEMSGVFNAQASAGLRFSSDNGATFPAASNEFRYTIDDGRFSFADASAVASAGDGDATWFPILDHGGDTGWPAMAVCTIRHFNDNRNAVGLVESRINTPQARYVRKLGAAHLRNLSMNALRFSLSATTVQFGSLDIWGLRG